MIEEQTFFEVKIFTEYHLRVNYFEQFTLEVWKSKRGRFTIMRPYKKHSKKYAYSFDDLVKKLESYKN